MRDMSSEMSSRSSGGRNSAMPTLYGGQTPSSCFVNLSAVAFFIFCPTLKPFPEPPSNSTLRVPPSSAANCPLPTSRQELSRRTSDVDTGCAPPAQDSPAQRTTDSQRDPQLASNGTLNSAAKEQKVHYLEEDFQDAKLIFYYPENVSVEEKRGQVGMLEGLLAFTSLFSRSKESLRLIGSQHHLMVVYECEPSIWMVLCYRQPHVVVRKSPTEAPEVTWPDTTAEFDLREGAFTAALENLYKIFRLFHGSVTELLWSSSADDRLAFDSSEKPPVGSRGTRGPLVYASASRRSCLDDILSDFIPAYLNTIQEGAAAFHQTATAAGRVDGSPSGGAFTLFEDSKSKEEFAASQLRQASVFNQLNGFYFGPIERSTYLSVQTFLSILHRRFPLIKYSAVLFDAYLVYSGICQEDMKLLYSYLVCYKGTLSSRKLNHLPFGRIPTAASLPGGGASSFGRSNLLKEPDGFLLGPARSAPTSSSSSGEDLTDNGSTLFVPAITLADKSTAYLVVLLYHRITLIMILERVGDELLDVEMLNSIRDRCVRMAGGLKDLHNPVAEQFDRIMSQEDAYRFVYYNAANEAMRISNKGNVRPSSSLTSSPFGGFSGSGASASGRTEHFGVKNTLTCVLPSEMEIMGKIHAILKGTEKTGKECGQPGGFLANMDSTATTKSSGEDEKEKDHPRMEVNAKNANGAVGSSSSISGEIAEDEDTAKAQTAMVPNDDDVTIRHIYHKQGSGGWVVGTRSLDREFYLLLDGQSMTLTKAQDESARFSQIHLANIFVT